MSGGVFVRVAFVRVAFVRGGGGFCPTSDILYSIDKHR